MMSLTRMISGEGDPAGSDPHLGKVEEKTGRIKRELSLAWRRDPFPLAAGLMQAIPSLERSPDHGDRSVPD